MANVAKQALPAEVFTDTRRARPPLVACGGDLLPLPSGGRTNADNVVATALPVHT